jgi:hypothetical protein
VKKTAGPLVFAALLLLCGARFAVAAQEVSEEDLARIRAAAPEEATAEPAESRRLLVFVLCEGFRHDSIPHLSEAIRTMGEQTGAYEAVVSEDVEVFRPENLGQFDAVCMNNTTGTLFEDEELKASLLDFVREGGGLVGLHAATDCFYDWPEYGELIGAYFSGHPWHEEVAIKLDDPDHPLCAAFGGEGFRIVDEIYQFRHPYSRQTLRVLMSLDTDGTDMEKDGIGRDDGDFAVSWVRSYGKGRVFYCSLGHRREIAWDPRVLRHYLDGIQFALGDLPADTTPSAVAEAAMMGDYEGVREAGEGQARTVAQVIAFGGSRYRARMLDEFDRGLEPLAVLEGGEADGVATLAGRGADGAAWSGRMTAGGLVGRIEGEPGGAFELKKVVRRSPTLGAGPPPEAVVLLNGVGLGEWTHPGQHAWTVDLEGLIGGDRRAAYLMTEIVSPAPQDAVLELGSDDGIKAWLNGQLVHANNVLRGHTPGEDRVPVTLREGQNSLMLKVIEEGGDWAASARLVGPDGEPLEALAVVDPDGDSLPLAGSDGNLPIWRLAGPFTAGDAGAQELFDVAFPPEEAPEAAEWTVVHVDGSGSYGWRLTEEGAMEIVPGTGSAMSRREFGDHRIHVEFRTPLEPGGRGQGRGNSGVYVHGRYEIQILDSYGLEPSQGGCGGIYGVSAPRVNACAPPMQWQTYDIEFAAAQFDADGAKTGNARITVRHNGVAIHADAELPGATPGGLSGEETAAGPLFLQDHGHAVQFRNIWVVEGSRAE